MVSNVTTPSVRANRQCLCPGRHSTGRTAALPTDQDRTCGCFAAVGLDAKALGIGVASVSLSLRLYVPRRGRMSGEEVLEGSADGFAADLDGPTITRVSP